MNRGYQYLKLVRTLIREEMAELLHFLDMDMESKKFNMHRKKWHVLVSYPYPVTSYNCDSRPIFSFAFVDKLLCSGDNIAKKGVSIVLNDVDFAVY